MTGESYKDGEITVYRMENDYYISVRVTGPDCLTTFIDAGGHACKSSGNPEHYELRCGESLSIEKYIPMETTNRTKLYESPQPKPEPIDIPVDSQDGLRQIELEDL